MGDSNIVTQAEFARRWGRAPSYISQLKAQGRLVTAPDGRHLLYAESMARIQNTSDPAHAAVAARWAANRDGGDAPPPGLPGAPDVGASYSTSRAVKEKYYALSAKREYEVAIGKLIPKDKVDTDTADAIVTLRASLERLPYTLGPVIASVSDEHVCTATIAEHVEQALSECARALTQIAQPPAQ